MTYARLNGGVDWSSGEDFFLDDANRIRDSLDKLALATLQRNIFAGGSSLTGIDASASGDVDLLDWAPLEIDNTSAQFSGFSDSNGAVLVARFRFLVRVSNGAITVTPKLRYGSTITTITTAATISGDAACSATDEDYSGTDQYQTVTVTLPSGKKLWKPQLTIGGVPAAGYQVWGRAWLDLFVQP